MKVKRRDILPLLPLCLSPQSVSRSLLCVCGWSSLKIFEIFLTNCRATTPYFERENITDTDQLKLTAECHRRLKHQYSSQFLVIMNSYSYDGAPNLNLLPYNNDEPSDCRLRFRAPLPTTPPTRDIKVIRDLSSIRRRRSDPATRRWREQCSRIFQEHVCIDIPERQKHRHSIELPAIAKRTSSTSHATSSETIMKSAAAIKIQTQMRIFLRSRRTIQRASSYPWLGCTTRIFAVNSTVYQDNLSAVLGAIYFQSQGTLAFLFANEVQS